MPKVDLSKIVEVLDSVGVDNDTHKIKFTLIPTTSSDVREENGTRFFDLRAQVDAESKLEREKISFVADLLKVPSPGEGGYVVKGKSRQVIAKYTMSYGWYVSKATKALKVDHLKLSSEKGPNLLIFVNNFELRVTTGKTSKMDESIPLAVFLKALSGNTFAQLARKIGPNTVYSQMSFPTTGEPTRMECVDMSIKTLIPFYTSESRKDTYETFSDDAKFNILASRFLLVRNMYLGNTAGVRMKRMLSFSARCKNTYLGKAVSFGEYKFEKGVPLDSRVLETLDYLPIDTLEVVSAERKKYTIKKNSDFNFRALGGTLMEDVPLDKSVVPAGTELTVPVLRELSQSTRDSIKVRLNGKLIDSRRTVYDGSLTVDDLISVTQTYVDSLCGLNLYENIYGTMNQNLETIDIKMASFVKENCLTIIGHLTRDNLQYNAGQDLMSKNLLMEPLPLDGLMEFIESADTRESQSADKTNTLHNAAKNKRAAKQVKRSSTEMREVQSSQFSRLDTTESPESSKIGTVHSMTFFSKTDENGFLVAPRMRVKNGVVIGTEPVYLTAEEEENEFIASWDETFHETLPDGTKVKKKRVLALSSSTVLEVPTDEVRYCQVSPFDDMSPARMMVTFIQHSQPKRQLMSANQHKQAMPLINAQRPLVGSGGEYLLGAGFITARMILTDYYAAHKIQGVSEEEFLTKSLKLENVEIVKDFKIIVLSVVDHDGPLTQIEVPFMQKASSGSLFSYEINTRTGLVFREHQVVAHAMDINIDEHTIYKHVDYGHMKVAPEMDNQALSLSRNIVVAWKTHESSTIDDAVVLSSEMVDADLLTSVELHSEVYELRPEKVNSVAGTYETESFGFYNGVPNSNMDITGLPKVGTILRAGDVVIGVKIEKREANRTEGYIPMTPKTNHKLLEGCSEGQVVYARIEDNVATVVLASLKPIEPGDKMAGRHGNKGVVARIVPKSHMPFDPVTGMTVQMILNPLGIPSRINLSQLLEAALGLSMLRRGKNEVCVITPYKADSLEFVKRMSEENGVKPTMLRDGRTGQWFKRPINIGVLYVLKLEHMVSHKSKATGIDSRLDPVFNQPSKGGGGQAIGEMETWCLRALGANKVLDDLFSVMSDDLDSIRELRAAIPEDWEHVEVEGVNRNDHFFQAILRSLCVEPQYNAEGSMVFRPLADDYVRALSSMPVDINNKASLESADIFGVTSNNMLKHQNRTRWSWMPLHCEIVHPFFIVKGKINKLLLIIRMVKEKKGPKPKVTFATQEILWNLVAEKCSIIPPETPGGLFTVLDGKVSEGMTGMSALVHLLRNSSLDDALYHLEDRLTRAKSVNTQLELKRQIYNIKEFIETGITLSDFVISTIPVMPLAFRPKAKFDRILQDFDFYYGRIMDEVVRYTSASIKSESGKFAIFMRIAEFCGLNYGKEIKKNDQYKPLIKYFTGREGPDSKHGRVRESLLKKRTLFSGRTVITPSSDTSRRPNVLGLPFWMVVEIYKLHLVHLLKKEVSEDLSDEMWAELLGLIATNRNMFDQRAETYYGDVLTGEQMYNAMFASIRRYIEGYTNPVTGEVEHKPQVVLAGRQPTLHQFNIRAYFIKILRTRAIEVHPVVCKMYNADFDGDQMWIQALINDSAKEEALRLMSPEIGIINPKDRSVIMEHSQDMRLGVYFATMLYDNVAKIQDDERYNTPPKFYHNLGTLSADIDLNITSLHELVIFNRDGDLYFSTAGRILFNGLFPNGMGFTQKVFSNPLKIPNVDNSDFKDLRYDGLISGNGGTRNEPVYCSLSKAVNWGYETYNVKDNMNLIQAISEFGFKYSDMSGISLSLEDLVQDERTDKYIARAQSYAEIINNKYFKGMLSEAERKEELIYLYTQCKAKIKNSFMKRFHRNNNMFIMYDSGARGNEDQIVQSVGMIGIMQKTKDEVLEIPILTNYTRGITAIDGLQLAYSTRVSVASTQNETADSGELTRLAVFMSGGIEVVMDDCGVGFEDFKVWQGETKGRLLTPEGVSQPVSSLTGKTLGDDPRAHKHLLNFLGPDNLITEKCVSILLKKKIQTVTCTDGVYQLLYKPDSLMTSMLLYREAEGLDYLIGDRFISEDTIRSLETKNIETIRVRTMLGCRAKGGVCQRCYGLRYNTRRLPEIGSSVGVESSQCIGEPAAQLSLSLFHTGGEAGKSVDKGVELYMSVLKTGFSYKLSEAMLAPFSGYVTVGLDKHRPQIVSDTSDAVGAPFCENELVVDTGEYVEKYSPLSHGFAAPKWDFYNPSVEELRLVQMSLLNIHFRIFETNNIKVFARHFELFVRAQTILATVVDSTDPEFKEGGVYEIYDIWDNAKGEVNLVSSTSKSSQVIEHFSGPEALMAHSDLATNLGEFTTTGTQSKNPSFIGKLFQGRSVSKNERKIFTAPTKIVSSRATVELEAKEEKQVSTMLLNDDLVQEIEVEAVVAPDLLSWEDMFGDDFNLGEESPQEEVAVEETVISLEDESETDSESPESTEKVNTGLKTSKAF